MMVSEGVKGRKRREEVQQHALDEEEEEGEESEAEELKEPKSKSSWKRFITLLGSESSSQSNALGRYSTVVTGTGGSSTVPFFIHPDNRY